MFRAPDGGLRRHCDSAVRRRSFEEKPVSLFIVPLCAQARERPFFVPSPAIRFPERAEGVKGDRKSHHLSGTDGSNPAPSSGESGESPAARCPTTPGRCGATTPLWLGGSRPDAYSAAWALGRASGNIPIASL